jgi:transposase
MALLALSPQERGVLERLISTTALTNEARRAQALLWLDEGESLPAVAARLRVSRQTIYNWAARFKGRRGGADIPARLADDKRSGRPGIVPRLIDPLIRAVLERDPHEFGYCAPVWTATLLARYLWEMHHITVSRRSVSLSLRRLNAAAKKSAEPASARHPCLPLSSTQIP